MRSIAKPIKCVRVLAFAWSLYCESLLTAEHMAMLDVKVRGTWAAPFFPSSFRNLPHARKEGICHRLVYRVKAAAAAHWHWSLVPTLQGA
jgi:hypothetical protein